VASTAVKRRQCEAGRDLGAPISQEPVIAATDEPTLADKVTFLSQPDVYGKLTGAVFCRETHMSWIFFAGDRVFTPEKWRLLAHTYLRIAAADAVRLERILRTPVDQ
jgi:hypothetical protein